MRPASAHVKLSAPASIVVTPRCAWAIDEVWMHTSSDNDACIIPFLMPLTSIDLSLYFNFGCPYRKRHLQPIVASSAQQFGMIRAETRFGKRRPLGYIEGKGVDNPSERSVHSIGTLVIDLVRPARLYAGAGGNGFSCFGAVWR